MDVDWFTLLGRNRVVELVDQLMAMLVRVVIKVAHEAVGVGLDGLHRVVQLLGETIESFR